MLTTVEGVYRDGQVIIPEVPADAEGARVLVTFLPQGGLVDLQARGITAEQAAETRWRFGAIAEDWDRPEMSVYDEL